MRDCLCSVQWQHVAPGITVELYGNRMVCGDNDFPDPAVKHARFIEVTAAKHLPKIIQRA